MRATVMLLTWSPDIEHERTLYAQKTVVAALEHLLVDAVDEIAWHIADDGSDPRHLEELHAIFQRRGIAPTMSNADRGGYGASYNRATQVIHDRTDYVLPLEDDWILQRDLNLSPLMRAIEASDLMIRSIRLGYLGFTDRLLGQMWMFAGQKFLRFDPSSPEKHIFSGHPRLETVEYQRDVGPWPEGIGAGHVELEVAGRPAARAGVAWPTDLILTTGDLWPHAGTISVKDAPLGHHG